MTLAEAEQAVIRAAIEWQEYSDFANNNRLGKAVDALLALRLADAGVEAPHLADATPRVHETMRQRYRAGERVAELVKDYGCTVREVLAAWESEPVPEQAKAEELK